MHFAIPVERGRCGKVEFVDDIFDAHGRETKHGEDTAVFLFEQPGIGRLAELGAELAGEVGNTHAGKSGELIAAGNGIFIFEYDTFEIDPVAHDGIEKPHQFFAGIDGAQQNEKFFFFDLVQVDTIDSRGKIYLQETQEEIDRRTHGKRTETGLDIFYLFEIILEHVFVAKRDVIVRERKTEITNLTNHLAGIRRRNRDENELSLIDENGFFPVAGDARTALQDKNKTVGIERMPVGIETLAPKSGTGRKAGFGIGFVIHARNVLFYIIKLHTITGYGRQPFTSPRGKLCGYGYHEFIGKILFLAIAYSSIFAVFPYLRT